VKPERLDLGREGEAAATTVHVRDKGARLDQACLDLLRGPRHAGSGAIPTSIRFLFYELEQAGILRKGGRRADLSEAVTRLRQAGLIPWNWIVDETRSLDEWPFFDSITDYAIAAVRGGRIDCWDGEPPPLIITESRSLAGVLRRIASRYLCPIAATNGQVGGFLHTDIIPALRDGQRVIYLGDEDLAGHQIEENTRRVLEQAVGELDWERLALTPSQVNQYRLASIPKLDRRYSPPRPGVAYETEALSQTIIQNLLIERLDDLLPEPLDEVRAREREQRQEVLALLR
jgi:hypothetical protein